MLKKLKIIKQKKAKNLFVILDNIRSLYNVGAIFRTADGFGVNKIYLCGITGKPINRFGKTEKMVQKTALGAEKYIPWEYYKNIYKLIDKLKKEKIKIAALENTADAIDLKKFKPKFPLALILGSETKGLSKKILEKSDKIIKIPMQGKKESLNVSIAFGIAAYKINEKTN